MVIDLHRPLLLLDGKPATDPNTKEEMYLDRMLAVTLSQNVASDPVKVYAWCQTMYAGKSLDLDRQDVTLLKTTVEGLQMHVLVQAQILSVILDAIDTARAKPTTPEAV